MAGGGDSVEGLEDRREIATRVAWGNLSLAARKADL
jgi:hypothetical protein